MCVTTAGSLLAETFCVILCNSALEQYLSDNGPYKVSSLHECLELQFLF